MSSGYTFCACGGCFDLVVSDDMENPDYCDECIKALCHEIKAECQREDQEDQHATEREI